MAFISSKDLPNVRPVADFNFAATKVLDNRINFSRGSIGTYTDNMGVLRYAPNNVPRFDHDPATGESLGLLIEESRANLISTNIDNWNVNTTIKNKNAGIAPDGTNTANKFIRGPVATYQNISATVTNVPTGTALIMSWYMKAAETDSIFFQSNDGNWINAQFDISNGGSTGGSSIDDRGMYAVGNGWYRCWVKFDSASNALNLTFHPISSSPVAGNSIDGTLIWGVQLEAGSFPTSYIPTSGSTVTRSEDQAVVKGEKFKKIFDTGFSSFSALIDYDNLSTDDGDNHGIFAMWGEETNYDNRIELFKSSSSPYHIMTRADGGGGKVFADATPVGSDKSAVQKIAFSWSVPDYSNTTSRRWAMSFSGEDVDEIADSTGTSTPALTRLGIGINPTRLDLEAGLTHYKRVAIYNTVLTDGELKGLSAI